MAEATPNQPESAETPNQPLAPGRLRPPRHLAPKLFRPRQLLLVARPKPHLHQGPVARRRPHRHPAPVDRPKRLHLQVPQRPVARLKLHRRRGRRTQACRSSCRRTC